MPHRSRDNQRNFLPKSPTSPHSHPSLLFSVYEIEHPLGEQPKDYEEPIREEEELASPIQDMAEIVPLYPQGCNLALVHGSAWDQHHHLDPSARVLQQKV